MKANLLRVDSCVTKACSAFPQYFMPRPLLQPPPQRISDNNMVLNVDFETKKTLIFVLFFPNARNNTLIPTNKLYICKLGTGKNFLRHYIL